MEGPSCMEPAPRARAGPFEAPLPCSLEETALARLSSLRGARIVSGKYRGHITWNASATPSISLSVDCPGGCHGHVCRASRPPGGIGHWACALSPSSQWRWAQPSGLVGSFDVRLTRKRRRRVRLAQSHMRTFGVSCDLIRQRMICGCIPIRDAVGIPIFAQRAGKFLSVDNQGPDHRFVWHRKSQSRGRERALERG